MYRRIPAWEGRPETWLRFETDMRYNLVLWILHKQAGNMKRVCREFQPEECR